MTHLSRFFVAPGLAAVCLLLLAPGFTQGQTYPAGGAVLRMGAYLPLRSVSSTEIARAWYDPSLSLGASLGTRFNKTLGARLSLDAAVETRRTIRLRPADCGTQGCVGKDRGTAVFLTADFTLANHTHYLAAGMAARGFLSQFGCDLIDVACLALGDFPEQDIAPAFHFAAGRLVGHRIIVELADFVVSEYDALLHQIVLSVGTRL